MATENRYDLVVLGGGSGGVRAARIAASYGKKVALVEGNALGGTCVNVGCIPKKLMVIASEFAHQFEQAKAYGWHFGEDEEFREGTPRSAAAKRPVMQWSRFVAARRQEIARLNSAYASTLSKAGVEVLQGWGRFEGPHELTVQRGDKLSSLKTEHALIAVGGRASRHQIDGAELAMLSDDVFDLEEIPKSLLVIGGGYIAVEFACIFAGLGCEVSLVHRGKCILRGFDNEVRRYMVELLRGRGIKVLLETRVRAIEGNDLNEARRCLLSNNSHCEVAQVLCAVGREPWTAPLNLDAAGVKTGAGAEILVDENYRTSAQHILAVGDVTGRIALTPVAIREGHRAVAKLFGKDEPHLDYTLVPTAVFSQPPLASVGLHEDEARAQGRNIACYRSSFRPLRQTLAGENEKVLMKMVCDAENDRVLGVHMVGEEAPEIIQSLAVALSIGATRSDFHRTLALHPSTAEEWVFL